MLNIIIGGTHGLGKELALELRERDQETFVVGRSYDKDVHGDGMSIDLALIEDADKIAEHIVRLGEAATLSFWWVSGYGYNGDFAEQQDPGVMAAVNFGNVLPAAQAAFRAMLRQDETSHFVVVSSTTGYRARQNEAVYSGTKHAQVGFTRSLGMESERLETNTKVALFMPGGMQTPFWEGNEPSSFKEFLDPSKVARHIVKRVLSQADSFYEEVIERGSL